MDSDSSFLEQIRDRSVLLCGRRIGRHASQKNFEGTLSICDSVVRRYSGGDLASFLARNATDRSRSLKAWLMAASMGKAAMTWVGRWGVIIQLRRLYITLPARETGLMRPTEARCNKRVPSGQRRWRRFGCIFACGSQAVWRRRFSPCRSTRAQPG